MPGRGDDFDRSFRDTHYILDFYVVSGYMDDGRLRIKRFIRFDNVGIKNFNNVFSNKVNISKIFDKKTNNFLAYHVSQNDVISACIRNGISTSDFDNTDKKGFWPYIKEYKDFKETALDIGSVLVIFGKNDIEYTNTDYYVIENNDDYCYSLEEFLFPNSNVLIINQATLAREIKKTLCVIDELAKLKICQNIMGLDVEDLKVLKSKIR